jgi:integrase
MARRKKPLTRQEIQAANHPKKGSSINIEPIRDLKAIKIISKLLSDDPRDHLLFTIGVNNGLRIGDLLKLRVRDVMYAKPGDIIPIKEGKTKKKNVLVVNNTVYKSLQNYLKTIKPKESDFLFKSKKSHTPISVQAANILVKKWTNEIGLKGNYGTHSLRKTWGYLQRTQFGVGFEVIAKRFNHSSPTITMRYLGIQDKEVEQALLNEIG